MFSYSAEVYWSKPSVSLVLDEMKLISIGLSRDACMKTSSTYTASNGTDKNSPEHI